MFFEFIENVKLMTRWHISCLNIYGPRGIGMLKRLLVLVYLILCTSVLVVADDENHQYKDGEEVTMEEIVDYISADLSDWFVGNFGDLIWKDENGEDIDN